MRFYHGSMVRLQPGLVLLPRPNYEAQWGATDFYLALETHRPPGLLAHRLAVFMCDNPDDVDLAGGGTEWLFTVEPIGPIQKHDLNWSSEISGLIGDGHGIDSAAVRECAQNYWMGVPHHNESVWEYLSPAARILCVAPY